MENRENIELGVCRKCDQPRYKGALCHRHYREAHNAIQAKRRERMRTKKCACGKQIFRDSTSCRACNLDGQRSKRIVTAPDARVFAGRWEEWAAMRDDVCPVRAKFVDRVERGRV